ncbi:SRPBCC family protein [Ancylobacter sp. SL191]|uniref:SRPBCC family protein n=1 Tax=Ancylobacter sp. SL191 TaxID=2995166 RepID=UPI00227204A3|nr:SRPBCC family protein [Ancylobacter sp. SL191]WAC25603.1 SRPBCC family protein [Ancylobacter sp. SL191]
MKLEQNFIIDRPSDAVWAAFHDIPAMAACLPGAEYLGPRDAGRHAGKVTSKIGPFQASFEGEAEVIYDDTARTIAVDGKGVDRKGNSRGRMTMTCTLAPDGAATKVGVVSDVQLSGTIAQFGRTGLITEIANVLVADFVRNVEATIPVSPTSPSAAESGGPPTVAAVGDSTATAAPSAPATRPAARPLGTGRLILMALRSWLSRLFARA